ncbi:MAG: hypothetical protein ACTSRU_17090 [Candidatus Hodarchaeales archaeon]
MPERVELEECFKGIVEFPVYCPECGPDNVKIKKNGLDNNHADHPQLFYCKKCRKSFYTHTSWVFKVLAEIEFERIINSLFEDKLRPKAVAKIYQVAPSLISKILNHCKEVLDQKLLKLASRREQLARGGKLPVPLEDAIWWDETFFTLGKTSWCLILLVDARGSPLTWKFGKSRTKDDYLGLLLELGTKLPSVPFFVGDGWGAYQKTCKELGRECYLVEHVHSRPWENARIHHFVPGLDNKTVIQTSMELPYNSFILNTAITGKAFERQHSLVDHSRPKRKRGRPVGSKDKKKRKKRGERDESASKKSPLRRGPKSLARDGRSVRFHPDPLAGGWNLEWMEPPLAGLNLLNPSLESLERMLDRLYKVMKGGTIQSNRIENVNREIKAVFPDRGIKNPEQAKKLLDHHLTFWSDQSAVPGEREVITSSVSRSIAFRNMLTYFKPSVSQVEVVETFLFKEV